MYYSMFSGKLKYDLERKLENSRGAVFGNKINYKLWHKLILIDHKKYILLRGVN